MAPVQLEFGKPAADSVTWGPRIDRTAGAGRLTVQRVDFGSGGGGRATESVRQMPRGDATVRMVIDAEGTVVAREVVRSTGTEDLARFVLERVDELRIHPAQRNGCAIPSVADWTWREPR